MSWNKDSGLEQGGCRGLVGALLGHKFEARYDQSTNEASPVQLVNAQFPESVLERAVGTENLEDILIAASSEKSVYVQDVCVRCGKVVRREGQGK